MLTTPWSIVLAAGQGRRLSSVTGTMPKQFWSPHGGPTLLEDTMERIALVTPITQTITVIDRSQLRYADRLRQRTPLGRVVLQPMDRGTAAGVLFGLSEIRVSDGIVVLTPSDHGVADLIAFRRAVRKAAGEIRRGRAEIVMFAAPPASPTEDYGWILPPGGDEAARRFPAVGGFVEKPQVELAHELFKGGGLWNTMVIVARLDALMTKFQQHLPRLTRVFEEARRLPDASRNAFLAERYPSLPRADFSRDLIAPSTGLQFHVWPASMGWSDLGTPERLHAWLNRQKECRPRPCARPADAGVSAVVA
jgi:mannose-1-phosphate guanylyltransferase